MTVTGGLSAAGSCIGIGFGAEDIELEVDEVPVFGDTELEVDEVIAVEDTELEEDNGATLAATPCVGDKGAACEVAVCDEGDGWVSDAHEVRLEVSAGAGPNAV